MKTKTFKVVAVSKNHNSFGLKGHIVMSKDGECWEIAGNHLNEKKRGELLTVNLNQNNIPNFSGFEIPRKLDNAPKHIREEVFG